MTSRNISQGASVQSADGETLGRVITAEEHYIIVEKGIFFPTDYAVPSSAIASADESTVTLSVSMEDVRRSDWNQRTGFTASESEDALSALGIEPDLDAVSRERIDDVVVLASESVASVPVYEEELVPTKHTVEQGTVRVRKDVVVEERTVDVPVTEERVRVTRRRVDRDPDGAGDLFTEATIDIPLRGEEVQLEPRARVAEEVEFTTESVQRTKSVTGEIRREEVRVEDEIDTSGGRDR